jgi:hypothetical protein
MAPGRTSASTFACATANTSARPPSAAVGRADLDQLARTKGISAARASGTPAGGRPTHGGRVRYAKM